MFRTITSLIFGGKKETCEEVQPGEMLEEDWLLVSHQETVPPENQDAEVTDSQPITAVNMETDQSCSTAEPPVDGSSSSSPVVPAFVSKPKALNEMMQLTCVQKTRPFIDPNFMSRNSIKRQNRIRHGVQHHSFPLHQPGHRN